MRPWATTLLLVLACALLLVSALPADLLAFGLHEHVTAPEQGSGLTGSDDVQSPVLSHHCELSASSAMVVAVVELPLRMRSEIELPEHRAGAARYRPFVPLSPPRA